MTTVGHGCRRAGGLALVLVLLTGCIDARREVDKRTDVKTGAVGDKVPPDMRAQDLVTGDVHSADVRDGAPADTPAPEVETLDVFDAADGGDVGDDLVVDAEADLCQPQCEGLECGPDMCGGVCGYCPGDKVCSLGQCVKCTPDCGFGECGSDGCGGVCGVCPAKFTCIGGFCQAPDCAGFELLFEETFDDCTQGSFAIEDFQPDDAVTWWALPLKNTSPPCALYLGDPESLTYFTGGSVHLELTSPPIAIPSGKAWQLLFRLFIEAEPVPAPQYPYDFDVLFLYWDPVSGGPSTLLWSSKEVLNSSDGEMMPLAIELSPFAGTTGQFRFQFDTIDATANDYPGIYLDDFRIGTICPYCLAADDCPSENPCAPVACLPFVNSPQVGTCFAKPIEDCCLEQDVDFCDDQDPCTLDSCDEGQGICAHEPIPDCNPPEDPDESAP